MDVTPRRIGPYEVEELLGEGGVGQVYAARDTLLGRRVAIKTLRPEMSRDRNLIERFYVEAKSLANLNHSNIATLYALQLESSIGGEEACMIMELINGCTLKDLLTRVHRLSLRESLAVNAQAVAGLRYAHRRGVVHRDIKPSNLMVTDEGVLKIMDFGVARVLGAQQLTRTGEFYGTIAYASPEQIRADPIDERSDIYSLAIVLYRLLAGTPPFKADSDYALMTAHLQTPPPPLGERVPELDANTEAVLMRALAKQPADRFATIEEFGRAVGANAIRGESVDILQQLYAEVFENSGSDATRVVGRRTALAPEAIAARPPADDPAPRRERSPPRRQPPADTGRASPLLAQARGAGSPSWQPGSAPSFVAEPDTHARRPKPRLPPHRAGLSNRPPRRPPIIAGFARTAGYGNREPPAPAPAAPTIAAAAASRARQRPRRRSRRRRLRSARRMTKRIGPRRTGARYNARCARSGISAANPTAISGCARAPRSSSFNPSPATRRPASCRPSSARLCSAWRSASRHCWRSRRYRPSGSRQRRYGAAHSAMPEPGASKPARAICPTRRRRPIGTGWPPRMARPRR
jgi:serine/threonine protein kinase